MEENEYIENAELENVVIDGETITSQPNVDFEESEMPEFETLENLETEDELQGLEFASEENYQAEENETLEQNDEVPEEIMLGQDDEKSAIFIENAIENPDRVIDFEENHKKVGVYIKVNEQGFIVDINSDIFIENFDGWIKIDEGEGDRFVHAQTCYFENSLIDETGNYRYRR